MISDYVFIKKKKKKQKNYEHPKALDNPIDAILKVYSIISKPVAMETYYDIFAFHCSCAFDSREEKKEKWMNKQMND